MPFRVDVDNFDSENTSVVQDVQVDSGSGHRPWILSKEHICCKARTYSLGTHVFKLVVFVELFTTGGVNRSAGIAMAALITATITNIIGTIFSQSRVDSE
jgi:hypothetical protein